MGVVCGDPCQSVFVHLFRTVDRVEEKDLVFQEMVTKLHLVQRGMQKLSSLISYITCCFPGFRPVLIILLMDLEEEFKTKSNACHIDQPYRGQNVGGFFTIVSAHLGPLP